MLRRPSSVELLNILYGCMFLATCATITGLVASALMEAQWSELMEAAWIKDWQPLSDTSEVHARKVCLILLLVMCALVVLRLNALHQDYSYYEERNYDGYDKKELLLLTFGAIMVGISSFGFSTFSHNECPQRVSAAAFATHPDAVANFNRRVCLAWCRATHNSRLALSCIFDEAPAAMDFATTYSVGRWCEPAIEANAFTANITSGSPFDSLVGAAGNCGPLNEWYVCLRVVFIIALALSCVAPFVCIIQLVEELCKSRTPAQENLTIDVKLTESCTSAEY